MQEMSRHDVQQTYGVMPAPAISQGRDEPEHCAWHETYKQAQERLKKVDISSGICEKCETKFFSRGDK